MKLWISLLGFQLLLYSLCCHYRDFRWIQYSHMLLLQSIMITKSCRNSPGGSFRNERQLFGENQNYSSSFSFHRDIFRSCVSLAFYRIALMFIFLYVPFLPPTFDRHLRMNISVHPYNRVVYCTEIRYLYYTPWLQNGCQYETAKLWL